MNAGRKRKGTKRMRKRENEIRKGTTGEMRIGRKNATKDEWEIRRTKQTWKEEKGGMKGKEIKMKREAKE